MKKTLSTLVLIFVAFAKNMHAQSSMKLVPAEGTISISMPSDPNRVDDFSVIDSISERTVLRIKKIIDDYGDSPKDTFWRHDFGLSQSSVAVKNVKKIANFYTTLKKWKGGSLRNECTLIHKDGKYFVFVAWQELMGTLPPGANDSVTIGKRAFVCFSDKKEEGYKLLDAGQTAERKIGRPAHRKTFTIEKVLILNKQLDFVEMLEINGGHQKGTWKPEEVKKGWAEKILVTCVQTYCYQCML